MTTPTPPQFLLARIAEDEAVVGAIDADPHRIFLKHGGARFRWYALCGDRPWKNARDRVLAECDAKRRIIDLADDLVDEGDNGPCDADRAREFRVAVWRTLATPYADHKDFREEWRL